MNIENILILICIVASILVAGIYFLNRWASKRIDSQEEIIKNTKQTISIYIIDKKKMKVSGSNLPKAVLDNLPKIYKFMKVPLVKAKVGPQIMTMMCDKKVYNILPIKKNVKVEVAGIYIMSMIGMKSEKEMKAIKQQKNSESNPAKKPWYKFSK